MKEDIQIIKNGATSFTFKAPHIFVKYITKYKEFDVYKREKYLASILQKFDWFPKLLYTDDKNHFFIYSNVGNPLTRENAPEDLEKQFNKILTDLKSVNIQHNDIKQSELLIDNNNKIYLCDFGWGSVNNNMDCNMGFWECHNKNKPGGYYDDAATLIRLNLTSNIKSELHILIDWSCHFNNLENKFTDSLKLVEKIHMNKMKDKSKTMSKFYNVKVDDYRGSTDFNLYIINDSNPVYDYRKTSKGNRKVNVHLFDLKKSLRKITGGYKIHATDNIQETKDNLKTLGIYDKYYNKKTFNTLQDVFHELNKHPKLKWVVMRNFEDMPDNITIDEHLDVDLLVSDYYLVKTILDGTSATTNRYEDGKNRILNYVTINKKKVLFDFRSVGDNYYDKKLQQDMLNTRIKHPNGFYIPNKEMHLYSLIYHAIIHKPKMSSTYLKVFKQYGLKDSEINKKNLKKKLDAWLQQKEYSYCRPEPSVGYYLEKLLKM